MDERRTRRTVHLIVPWTGRSLCGYEEVRSSAPQDTAEFVPCPECSAVLRSGVLARRPAFRPRPEPAAPPRVGERPGDAAVGSPGFAEQRPGRIRAR